MATEAQVWHRANAIVRAEGDEATLFAAIRADLALKKGKKRLNRYWMRVLAAVKELQRKKSRQGESFH